MPYHSRSGWRIVLAALLFSLPTPILADDGAPPPKQLQAGFPVLQVTMSPHGKLLAAFGTEVGMQGPGKFAIQAALMVFDLESGKVIFKVRPSESIKNGARGYTSAGSRQRGAFSPDGKALAWAGVNNSHSAYVWHTKTGKVTALGIANEANNEASAVAYSPDGKLIAVSLWRGEIQLYDATTGKMLQKVTPDFAEICSVVFSPNGRQLLFSDRQKDFGLLDVASGKLVRSWSKDSGQYPSLGFSPDGILAATSGNGQINLWEVTTGELLYSFGVGVSDFVFGNNIGQMIVGTEQDTVEIWDLLTGEMTQQNRTEENVKTVAVPRNGRQVAVAIGTNLEGTILVWKDLMPAHAKKNPPLPNAEAEKLWENLSKSNTPAIYQSMIRLIAGKDESVKFLATQKNNVGKKLKITAREIEAFIANLDNERFIIREKATRELKALGKLVKPFLEQALRKKLSLEARERINLLVRNMVDVELTPQELREIRMVGILQRISTDDARSLLTYFAKDRPNTALGQMCAKALKKTGN